MPDDPAQARSNRREIEALEDENTRLREQLGSVLESSSWRLTRPVRRLRRSARPESPPPRTVAPAPDEAAAGPATEETPVPLWARPGHFYSPLLDPAELASEPRHSQVWPREPRATPGIDWREREQIALCRDVFSRQTRLVFREEAGDDPTEFFALNDQYPPLDAWMLEAMLQWLRPRRMIEVGSGFSSLVTARVNREHLDGRMRFTCIEPYPRQFLIDGVPGVTDLMVAKIQDVPLEEFASLGAGDILFVDTSHTVKTGGDVPWLFHEVIPRLGPGVMVHVHDVFLPGDYPEDWVMEGRGWNETYLLHSFLAFNNAFEVVLGARYMAQLQREALAEAFPGWPSARSPGGAAVWFRRRP